MTDGPNWKPCELRRTQPLPDGRGVEIWCGAGEFRLAAEGGDTRFLAETCGSCDIPDVLARDRWACLHLRPVRVPAEGGYESRYACRWLYGINPVRVPRRIDAQCHHCPWWFPRPPAEAIKWYWEETSRVLQAVRTGEPPPTLRPAPAPPPTAVPRPSLWRRLLARWRRGPAPTVGGEAHA